jgi:hypothetical protein
MRVGSSTPEEGILYADCNLELAIQMKLRHDFAGHYNRLIFSSFMSTARHRSFITCTTRGSRSSLLQMRQVFFRSQPRVWHRPNQSHSSSLIAPSCRLCDAVICNRNDGYELGCFADVTTNSFNFCHTRSTSLSCLASTAKKQPDRSCRSRYRN